MAKSIRSAATATVIRRPTQNAIRAQRAADRKAYEDSFSYEDDLRRRAESTVVAPAAAEPKPKRKG